MDVTWSLLRDKYYKKEEVYEMGWSGVDLTRSKLIGGPLGGPIVVTRDDSKVQRLGPGSLKPSIDIYSSSGQKLSSFLWEKGRIIKMGWDDIERLIILLDDGSLLIYSIFGELIRRFILDRKEIRDNGVEDAFIWSSGLVCMTKNYQFFCMMNYDDPYIVKLKDPLLDSPPTCWTVIEPQLTENSTVQVLVATASGTILSVDTDQVQDMLAPGGPFLAMSVAPTGKILACFTKTGNVWVVSTDFAQNLSTFETKSSVPPQQLVWCGFGAVCCYWGSGDDNLLFIVGPYASYYKYLYAEPISMIPEPDGVRIVSSKRCEFLSRVSPATEAVFKSNSTSPAALLKDAFEEFEKNSPKSDELIREIGEDLPVAIDNVIDAAAMEFDQQQQRMLLKAASFGKAFRDFYPPEKFVDVCKTVRILNQVRDFRLGMPITYAQYKILGADLLIDRLINRHHHFLAYQICDYLGLRTSADPGRPAAADKVLIHWACAKVKANAAQLNDSDENALRHFVAEIASKLAACPGISYAEIASAAHKANKPHLATILLDNEPRAQDQVPLLISMKQPEHALEKAIESGDSDLGPFSSSSRCCSPLPP